MRRALMSGVIRLRFQFVIDVRAEPVKIVIALFARDKGAHLQGLHVLQLDDGAGDNGAAGISHNPSDRALRWRFILLAEDRIRERKNQYQGSY